MVKKTFTSEQIIFKLQEAVVFVGQGEAVASACWSVGGTEQTYYRWPKQYGGMDTEQLKRLKELEKENQTEAGSGEFESGKTILGEVSEDIGFGETFNSYPPTRKYCTCL